MLETAVAQVYRWSALWRSRSSRLAKLDETAALTEAGIDKLRHREEGLKELQRVGEELLETNWCKWWTALQVLVRWELPRAWYWKTLGTFNVP